MKLVTKAIAVFAIAALTLMTPGLETYQALAALNGKANVEAVKIGDGMPVKTDVSNYNNINMEGQFETNVSKEETLGTVIAGEENVTSLNQETAIAAPLEVSSIEEAADADALIPARGTVANSAKTVNQIATGVDGFVKQMSPKGTIESGVAAGRKEFDLATENGKIGFYMDGVFVPSMAGGSDEAQGTLAKIKSFLTRTKADVAPGMSENRKDVGTIVDTAAGTAAAVPFYKLIALPMATAAGVGVYGIVMGFENLGHLYTIAKPAVLGVLTFGTSVIGNVATYASTHLLDLASGQNIFSNAYSFVLTGYGHIADAIGTPMTEASKSLATHTTNAVNALNSISLYRPEFLHRLGTDKEIGLGLLAVAGSRYMSTIKEAYNQAKLKSGSGAVGVLAGASTTMMTPILLARDVVSMQLLRKIKDFIKKVYDNTLKPVVTWVKNNIVLPGYRAAVAGGIGSIAATLIVPTVYVAGTATLVGRALKAGTIDALRTSDNIAVKAVVVGGVIGIAALMIAFLPTVMATAASMTWGASNLYKFALAPGFAIVGFSVAAYYAVKDKGVVNGLKEASKNGSIDSSRKFFNWARTVQFVSKPQKS